MCVSSVVKLTFARPRGAVESVWDEYSMNLRALGRRRGTRCFLDVRDYTLVD